MPLYQKAVAPRSMFIAFGSKVQSGRWSRSSYGDKEIRADISQDGLPDISSRSLSR
jgi:hypothetical protein